MSDRLSFFPLHHLEFKENSQLIVRTRLLQFRTIEDEEGKGKGSKACPQDLTIRWHTEVGSSILATPLITDLYSDNRKDIIIPGFRRRVHVLDGRTGGEDTNFEAEHHSTLHASPVLYDIDFDGVLDLVVATYQGDIQFFKDTGAQAAYRMFIPRLRVKRDWFKGLDPDPTDHSHPDVGADKDESGIGERANANANTSQQQSQRRRLMQADDAHILDGGQMTDEAANSFEELFDTDEEHIADGQGAENGDEPWLDDSLMFAESEEYEFNPDAGLEDSVLPHGGDVRTLHPGHVGQQERPSHLFPHAHKTDLEENAAPNLQDAWEDETVPIDGTNIDTSNGHNNDTKEPQKFRTIENESPFVFIDAHVLATPAIGDIDKDGRDELVLSVSYFFDPADYAAHSIATRLAVGKDGDIGNYLASGVVVFDLHSRSLKWSQHLDLSTKYTRYKAAANSSPTLADVDNDGRLEVIVGTSMGWIYVLDPANGATLDGWPVLMGDVQGHIAVGDLDGDGYLDLVAGDLRGSIAALRGQTGKELWERHLGAAVGAGATLGDVDGDGALEVVVPTLDGRLYVLDGRTGADKPNFPFRAYGRITTPVLVTKLDAMDTTHLQLVATAHDGHLYVIDALSGCADTMDLGGPSHAMVLAEDISSTGQLDLLVATVNGGVYAIRTGARYHPSKGWPSQFPGLGTGSCTARWNWQGVYVTATSRIARDVRGDAVPVRFTIMDRRRRGGDASLSKGNQYKVSATLQGVGVKEMGRGEQPVIGMSDVYNASGTYVLEVPCPKTRTSATVRVELRDETGSTYSDEFVLSFHMHFYRLLKWLLVGPFAFTAAAVFLWGGRAAFQAQLPT